MIYIYIYISPNSFSACVGPLLEPCPPVMFYRESAAKWRFPVSDLYKHVTFATLAHRSVANSGRIESHLASLSFQGVTYRSDCGRGLPKCWTYRSACAPGSHRRCTNRSACTLGLRLIHHQAWLRAASARRTRGTLPANTQRCADAMREQVDLTSQRALGAL